MGIGFGIKIRRIHAKFWAFILVFHFLIQWLPLSPSQAYAGDPFAPLEKAIIMAATNVSTSIDGLSKTITISASVLFELIQTYGPDLFRLANGVEKYGPDFTSLAHSAIEMNQYLPFIKNVTSDLVTSANQVVNTVPTVLSYASEYHSVGVSVANSLFIIASDAAYLRSIMDNPDTQITLKVSAAILGAAAVLYIGDCMIKIGKQVCKWGKSVCSVCKSGWNTYFRYERQGELSRTQSQCDSPVAQISAPFEALSDP